MRSWWILLAWLAFAVSATPLLNGRLELAEGTSPSGLVAKRADTTATKCSIRIVDDSDSSSKRRGYCTGRCSGEGSVGFLRLERNVTSTIRTTAAAGTKALAKRMVLPGDDLGEFYEVQMPKRTKPILFKKSYKRATDTSAAIMHEFSRARFDEFSTGVEGLHGCTTMYIISRKAVYITHWWENVAFDPVEWDYDLNEAGWLEPGKTPQDMLELTVLDLLRKGGKYHHKLDASIIEDDYIHAYMIRPTQAFRQLKDPSQSDYTDQWNQIRTLVGELVPKLQDQSRWTDVPYIAVPEDDDLDEENTVRGRNLFKYDRAQSIGGGQTQQWAMMWAEDDLYHEDRW